MRRSREQLVQAHIARAARRSGEVPERAFASATPRQQATCHVLPCLIHHVSAKLIDPLAEDGGDMLGRVKGSLRETPRSLRP